MSKSNLKCKYYFYKTDRRVDKLNIDELLVILRVKAHHTRITKQSIN